ncbi:MAG: hypothetical protein AAGI09_14340 [Pseudomonadota bacterium]
MTLPHPTAPRALRLETLAMCLAFLLVLGLNAGLVGEARGGDGVELDTSRKTDWSAPLR